VISDKDGMTLLYVPAGEFTMGTTTGNSDEKPVHKATLNAFWIDKTEVTNRMYALCVRAGTCIEPAGKSSATHSSYYGDSDFDNYPVIFMVWNSAKAYCEWADRRLPTEAEWEKAARGIDARTYPWGNDAPNSNLLNYKYAIGDVTEVGKYPNGASPYGALDMAGNAWEWVADWYSQIYYQDSPSSNPLGANSGQYKVLRGGTWYDSDTGVRSTDRGGTEPADAGYNVGFRCASSR
jgi:serine/threonine-protein kinase